MAKPYLFSDIPALAEKGVFGKLSGAVTTTMRKRFVQGLGGISTVVEKVERRHAEKPVEAYLHDDGKGSPMHLISILPYSEKVIKG